MSDDILDHSGVKGMKWGVRKDKGHEGEAAKTSKIAKLDKKFERDSQSYTTRAKIYNEGATKYNNEDWAKINNKPQYKNADFTKPSPLRDKYEKEHMDALVDRVSAAADSFGTNASGTKQYRIYANYETKTWTINTGDVRHDVDSSMDFKVAYTNTGHIASVTPVEDSLVVVGDSLAQSETYDDYEGMLEHFGVRGMKWGKRKGHDSSPTEVDIRVKPGHRVSTKGGANQPAHPDAIKTAVSKQKAKKSTTDSLSTEELQTMVNRMNLEQQYSRLTGGNQTGFAKSITKGKSVTSAVLNDQGGEKLVSSAVSKKLGDPKTAILIGALKIAVKTAKK